MQQGVVIQVPPEEHQEGFYSRVFLVRKPTGKFRLILNIKPLNKSVKYRKLKMDSIFFSQIYGPRIVSWSIDLKDGYLHIPMSPQSQKYLRLQKG